MLVTSTGRRSSVRSAWCWRCAALGVGLFGLISLAEGTRVNPMHDGAHTFEVEGQRVALAGIALDVRSLTALVAKIELLEDSGPGYRLLLAHRPEVIEALPDPRQLDLVVAGHTHGSQIASSGFGPLLTLTTVLSHVVAGGLHDLAGTRIVGLPPA